MRDHRSSMVLSLMGLLLITGAAAGPASALPLLMDYTGFSWTTQDGMGTLQGVGVIDGFDPGVPMPGEIYTYYFSDLVLADEVDLGNGYSRRTYAGGTFAIYESTGPGDRGYDYGTAPPDGSAPPSFVDGTFWLGGDFSAFTMLVDANHSAASFSGVGAYDGGAYFGNLEDASFFTFAGMTQGKGSAIPYGYEYRFDGQIDAAVRPVPEPATLLLMAGGLLGAGIFHRRSLRS